MANSFLTTMRDMIADYINFWLAGINKITSFINQILPDDKQISQISDFEFDVLKRKLIEASPDHPVFRVVESGRKLLSLGNHPVECWLVKITSSVELAVQPKIDGVAIAIRYVDGVIAKAWTRKGEDKTRNVLQADNIPPELPVKKTVEIRGELYAPNIDPARSQRLAAGLLRKKAPKDVEGISFCAFEILNADPEVYPDEAYILDQLRAWGFHVPPTTRVSGLSEIKDIHNNDIVVVQIAGLVARRIVCESNKDQDLKQGDRIGMIRFGSRADVYYENYEPLVKIGQTAIAGETLLALSLIHI